MKLVLYTCIVFFFIACSNEIDTAPKEVKWDRAECERCNMMLGDKDFAAQAVSIITGEAYYFDDIGCAIIWLSNGGNEVKIGEVILYVRNAKNDKFIRADEAKYTTDIQSPMSFNFLAHPKDSKVKNFVSYSEVVQKSLKNHSH